MGFSRSGSSALQAAANHAACLWFSLKIVEQAGHGAIHLAAWQQRALDHRPIRVVGLEFSRGNVRDPLFFWALQIAEAVTAGLQDSIKYFRIQHAFPP
jgi:hypothetical protein